MDRLRVLSWRTSKPRFMTFAWYEGGDGFRNPRLNPPRFETSGLLLGRVDQGQFGSHLKVDHRVQAAVHLEEEGGLPACDHLRDERHVLLPDPGDRDLDVGPAL